MSDVPHNAHLIALAPSEYRTTRRRVHTGAGIITVLCLDTIYCRLCRTAYRPDRIGCSRKHPANCRAWREIYGVEGRVAVAELLAMLTADVAALAAGERRD